MFRNANPSFFVHGSQVWLCLITLATFNPCYAQDTASDEETESKPSTNVISRWFGSSAKKSTAPEPAKPKVPATTTSGRTSRNGFMTPLKSFTKAFRGPTDSEMVEESEESVPPRIIPNRIPREPFRNLPRAQDRRDKAINDLHIEELGEIPSPQLIDTDRPAPIVRGETTGSGAKNNGTSPTVPLAPPQASTASKRPESKKPSSPEVIIESNSTSRRTAMDIQESTPPSRPIVRPETLAKQPAKKAETPKNLIDIGTATPDRQPDLMESTPSRLTSAIKEAPKSIGKTIAQETAKPVFNEPPKAISAPTSSSAELHRQMAIPGVSVIVNGPNAILIDQEGSYEVVAKNEGTESLNGLMVRVAVPHHVSIGKAVATDGVAQPENDQDGNALLWEIEHIPAGGSKSIRMMLQTSKPEHFALGVEWTVVPQSAEMQISVQQPQLTLALEGPSEVEFGKPQMYRIRVRNPGNADAKSVSISLSAEPYGSNQSDIGDIAAGNERIVEVELTFQQAGTLPILASAVSEVSKLKADSNIEVQVKQSELIATWFGPSEFYQGSVADYELELHNAGSIPAIGTACKIRLPSGADVVSMPAGATRTGDYIKWDIKKIEPQEKLTIPLRVILSKIGDNAIGFSAECTSGHESKADHVTNIDAIADLHLTVVDPVAPAPVGQSVVYEIVIANRGKKAASDVEVIAQFSDGIEPTRVEGHTGQIVPGQAVFNSIPSIGPGEKLVLRVLAQASKAGVHRFRVEVKSQGSETDLLEEESTRYLATGTKADRR